MADKKVKLEALNTISGLVKGEKIEAGEVFEVTEKQAKHLMGGDYPAAVKAGKKKKVEDEKDPGKE